MLSCSHSHFSTSLFHGRHHDLRPNPNPNPTPVTFHRSSPSPLKPLIRATASHDPSPSIETLTPANLSRRHNARSTALFLLHSEPPPPLDDNTIIGHDSDSQLGEDELRRKKIIEEASLATRRVPRFPGSVDFPKPEQFDPPIDLDRVAAGSYDDEDIRKALEIRRGVAAEILKEALRAGKLSVNYSANLVSRLGGFVDRVVIGAAAMKGALEFRHLSFNARAKSYIQSSGVVALVKWLKHNSMTYPQIGKVICVCLGELEQVRLVVEWLKTIHVKGRSLGVVFVKASSILERSSEELEEIVEYLIESGVRREWVGFVVTRCPQVLTLAMEDLVSRVKFYMDMGMNKEDFGTMVYDYPRVLGFFSLDEMNSKAQYLKEFGLNTEDVGRLFALKPQLMSCSIEEKWKPLVKFLYYLGVRRDGMKRILLVKPMIFCVDLETTIAPKVRFLQDLGIREEAIGSAVVRFPPLLTYSLYKKIRPVVIFLLTKAGVTRTDIAKVIAFDPQLTGCSIVKKLEVNVKYFLSLGIRLQSLGKMIADFPMLLRYNLDIIGPKYRYLRRIMVRPLQDLIEFPRFLSYSLEGRIIPRHKILVENRINFKLRYMLAGSDEEFNLRVQAAIENRRRFESGNTNSDVSDTESPRAPSVASINP